MRIVAFTGYKGSGKDTAAASVSGHVWKFAEPLKDMIRVYLFYRGASNEEAEALIEGALKEHPSRYFSNKTSRFAQQTLGTEWARNLIDSDIWVDTMEDRIRTYINTGSSEIIKITDVRFVNEAKMLQEKFNIPVIRIIRTGQVPDLSHPSEQEIDKINYDYGISNSGTIKQLEETTRKLLKDIF